MADLVKIIDGTEVGSPARDYSNLQDFETAYDGNDWSANDDLVAQIRNVPVDSGIVYWNGWSGVTLGASHRIVVEAYAGDETDFTNDAYGGRIEDRQYMFEASNTFYIVFKELELHVAINSSLAWTGNTSAATELIVTKCMDRDSFSGAVRTGIKITSIGGASNIYVMGCLGKNITSGYSGLVVCDDSDATVYMYNCTSVSSTVGIIQVNGTVNAQNCAFADNGTDVSGTVSETTNKSQDDGDITFNDADDFTEPSTDDFHVYDSNSNLYHTGTAIADSIFTAWCATDIDGTSWASPPSVGCFEVTGSPPATKLRTLTLTGVGR